MMKKRSCLKTSYALALALVISLIFNAAAAFAAPWSFAVLCDSRSSYSTDTLPNYYDATYGISPYFKNVAAALARETGLDFVLYPGDLVRGKKPSVNDPAFAADLQQWLLQMQPVANAGIPVYYVRGNHDAFNTSSLWTSNIPVPSVGGNPVNQDASQPGLTYSFTHKGSLFVGVDEYPNGAAAATGYDSAFLKAELAKPAKHKFVFAHQPVWNFKTDELGPVGLAEDMNNGGVDLFFSGHVHSYQRIKKNGYRFQEMIIGSGGAPQDNPTLTGTDPTLTVLASAGGKDPNARFGYAVITVNDDGSIVTKMKFLDDPTNPHSTVTVFDQALVKEAGWKFGVMSDTQWTFKTGTTPSDPAGKNPNAVSKSIIDQINPQFIQAGVKFVIQVGDLTENGNNADIAQRAAAAQPLIDAGIGFFPMRGNHETYANPLNNYGIPQFQSSFPQTLTGEFTKTNLQQFKLGSDFSSPTGVSMDLAGMSYSFDYGDPDANARFVIIDPWATPTKIDKNGDGYAYGYTVNDQQPWISHRLHKHTRDTEHAFVFSHQPLMAENHQDTMFSGYTNANTAWQDAFFASMQNNDARYFISGHDHIHQRSIVASPDGKSKVEELIAASNSSKFYTPKVLSDPNWFGQKGRETSISQERYTVGYYIYTVDGPCVTVDYYSDDHGNWQSDGNYPNGLDKADTGITPIFNFVKKETWGYCQNGKEFLVPQGATYKTVEDSFEGTTARILGGTNTSTARDGSLDINGGVGRKLTKALNTGWVDLDRWCEKHSLHKWNYDLDLASNIFRLQGLADLGSEQTDTYALSLSYDHHRLLPTQPKEGLLGLVTRDENGLWVNAVDMNFGGNKKFVLGPYQSSYGLGTYGIDLKNRTVWAVINYAGDFAAAGFRH